jgi:hypothetical protein
MTSSPVTTEDPFSQLFSQFLRVWNYQPDTSWRDFFNPQFIINSNTGDAPVENDVLASVGSYGKQLGTIIDALDVVIAASTFDHLLPADRRALDRFRALRNDVDGVVVRHRPNRGHELTEGEVADFLARLEALEREEPSTATSIYARLAEVVDDHPGAADPQP